MPKKKKPAFMRKRLLSGFSTRDKLKNWAFLTASLGVFALSCSPAQQMHILDDKDIKVIDYVDLGYYPAIAVTAHIEGVVVVRVTLDQKGKVLATDALSGSPVLAAAGVANAKRWRFEANPENAVIIVYNFRLRGSCHESKLGSPTIFYPPNFVDITGCPTPVNAP